MAPPSALGLLVGEQGLRVGGDGGKDLPQDPRAFLHYCGEDCEVPKLLPANLCPDNKTPLSSLIITQTLGSSLQSSGCRAAARKRTRANAGSFGLSPKGPPLRAVGGGGGPALKRQPPLCSESGESGPPIASSALLPSANQPFPGKDRGDNGGHLHRSSPALLAL